MWTFEDRNDPEGLLAFVVRHMERHGLPWTREVIAQARGAAALDPVVEKIMRLRVEGLHSADRYRDARDPRLEKLLPVERALAHYQVRGDGQMFGDRIEAVDRHPLAMLGMEAEWYVRAGVDRLTPISQGLAQVERGASRVPEADRGALLQAREVFVTEQRWLATFDNEDLEHPMARKRLDYDTIMHGLAGLFDPRIMQTPLESLPLPRAVHGRLVKALAAAPFETDAATVGGLPTRCGHLTALSGFGAATLDLLKIALLASARRWRCRQFDVEEARFGAVAPEASAALEGGLADLAALFG